MSFFQNIIDALNKTFIATGWWRYMTTGTQNTLILTSLSLCAGIVIGVVVALVRTSWDRLAANMRRGPGKLMFGAANAACEVYLTVIRGTPVLVQVSIIFFIFMTRTDQKMLAGVIAFGINSGAYVAEIIRGGIMSIDIGQTEAGRSLGFNYVQTMWYIILPQAFKNILPSLANEFIALLKETSVASFVGVTEIMRGANIIVGLSYDAVAPYISAALIYLALTMLFTQLVGVLERRLRNSDH